MGDFQDNEYLSGKKQRLKIKIVGEVRNKQNHILNMYLCRHKILNLKKKKSNTKGKLMQRLISVLMQSLCRLSWVWANHGTGVCLWLSLI